MCHHNGGGFEMSKINWGVVIFDISVMIMAVGVSMWQDNIVWMWLLVLIFFSGRFIMENHLIKDREWY